MSLAAVAAVPRPPQRLPGAACHWPSLPSAATLGIFRLVNIPVSDQTLNGTLCRLVDELVRQGLSLQQACREFERQYLLAALRKNEGSVSRSAGLASFRRKRIPRHCASPDALASSVAPAG